LDTHTKSTASKATRFRKTEGPKIFRDIAENIFTQAAETFTSTESVERLKNGCSTAVQGAAQDYNDMLFEFVRANTSASFDFFQKLATVKSPMEFVELSTEHARDQMETLTEQAKHLSTIAQEVTHAATEPFKMSVAKAFNSAA